MLIFTIDYIHLCASEDYILLDSSVLLLPNTNQCFDLILSPSKLSPDYSRLHFLLCLLEVDIKQNVTKLRVEFYPKHFLDN